MGLIFIRALPEAEFRHRAAHGFKPPYYVPPGTHASTADRAEAEIRLLRAERVALRARLAELEGQRGTGGWDEGGRWWCGEGVFPRDGLSEVTSAVRALPEGATVEDGVAEMEVSRMVVVGHDTAEDAEKEKLLIRVQHAEHEREGLQRRLEEAQAERDDFRHQLVEAETDRSTLRQHLTTAESSHTALEALYQQALSIQTHYLSQLRHHRGTISVIVRIRPPPASSPATPPPTHTITSPGTLHLPRPNYSAPETFTFDTILSGPSSTSSLAPQISSLATTTLQTHCRTTVFAYGRTGTGKSHTLSEVISTLAVSLFPASTTTPSTPTRAKVSFVEIYNDTLLDLLVAPKTRSTAAADSHHQQPEVKVKTTAATVDITRSPAVTETVSSAAGLLALVARGNARRAVGATECNAVSSRSHSVLTIQILLSDDDKGEETKKNGGKGAGDAGAGGVGGGGTFVVIDLAGHEDVGKSGVGERGGMAFAEARSINQSLHNLGKVFCELGGGRQSGKGAVSATASFRADLLTRVFGWVLGYGPAESAAEGGRGPGGRRRGRSRVLMVATVALDDAEGVAGARHTLGYAAQAARVRLDAVDAGA